MRLIDADAMKDTNDNVIAVIDPETKSKYWISLNDYINAQPTVPQFGQWISVKDRLPENDEPVLAIIEGVRRTAVFDGEFWWSYPEGEDFRDATKWMSLPEPPKEAKMNVKGTYCCDRSDARYIESGYCDGYEDAKRKYEPRWRNIEEELPQEAGDVIIYTDHVMAGYYAWGKWFDDKNELVTPTHWMPWPSAPERRQDK